MHTLSVILNCPRDPVLVWRGIAISRPESRLERHLIAIEIINSLVRSCCIFLSSSARRLKVPHCVVSEQLTVALVVFFTEICVFTANGQQELHA